MPDGNNTGDTGTIIVSMLFTEMQVDFKEITRRPCRTRVKSGVGTIGPGTGGRNPGPQSCELAADMSLEACLMPTRQL